MNRELTKQEKEQLKYQEELRNYYEQYPLAKYSTSQLKAELRRRKNEY